MGAAPIGKGDWVEYVSRDPTKKYFKAARHEGPPVVPGGLYRVRDIRRGQYMDGSREDGLRLVGIRGFNEAGLEGAWPVTLFRPVYRPDESFLSRLMSDLPADAPASPEEVVA